MAADDDDEWERGSLDLLRKWKIPYQKLSNAQLRSRWPQINFDEVTWGVFEPQSGYLTARSACQAVVDGFVKEGGEFRQVGVVESELDPPSWKSLSLTDGSKFRAHRYVFACGPWMGRLFPRVIGNCIRATKQDVLFFGTPQNDSRFEEESIPVWADHRGRFMYGIPGHQGRGFKIADDTRGPDFDPTHGERLVSGESLGVAREYLAFRFPGMKDAPLLETRVCQYENTPDNHFLVDRHPDNESLWLLGGGSGHGFKHGPALGEVVADLILKDKPAPTMWRLPRFNK